MAHASYESIPEKEIEEERSREEEEEEEPKVSNLELFSDLVIVVAIHVVAEPLEESSFNQFGLYFARVFYLWLAWHMVTMFMNAAVKMKSQNCPIHNFFIFIWMAFVLHMAQGFSIDNDAMAIKAYLGLRVFETLIYWRQVRFPFRAIQLQDGTMALSVGQDWLSAMLAYVPVMVFTLIFCEFIPLTLAIRFGTNGQLYYPLVLLSMCSIIASFLIGALGVGNRGKMLVNAFDADHLSERYELITLIFTGELCFAAGKPGNPYGSSGVLLMAFAAYLLTFKSFPLHGQIKFWARSVIHSVAGLFLYAGVFCAIPAMGSAFARIIEEGSERHTEDPESHDAEEGGQEGISSGDLLCYAAGSFMVFTAMINLINKDPVGQNAPALSSLNRGIIRTLTGVVIWCLPFFLPEEAENKDNAAAILVPLLALVATSIEIWSVGSLKIAI